MVDLRRHASTADKGPLIQRAFVVWGLAFFAISVIWALCVISTHVLEKGNEMSYIASAENDRVERLKMGANWGTGVGVRHKVRGWLPQTRPG